MASSSDGAEGPTRFRIASSPTGRGDICIGPDPYAGRAGALVIAPPGVLLRTPPGGAPLSREGWRIARWSPDEYGRVLIDQSRPTVLREVQLVDVVETVAEYAPDHLSWVAAVVERSLRLRLGRMAAKDHAARMHPEAPGVIAEYWLLRSEADAAFARVAQTLHLSAPFMRPGYFTELMRDGYLEGIQGRRTLESQQLASGERRPPGRTSTLRPHFRDDDEDRPDLRLVD